VIDNAAEFYGELQSGDYKGFREKLAKALPDVGKESLNDEHMGLLSIFFSFQQTIEDIRQRVASSTEWEKVAFDLQNLVDFTERHLKAEETLMKNCGHSYFIAHQAEHDVFRRKLKGYRDAIETKNADEILKLKYDMFEWFVQHINVTDMKYKDDIGKV